MLQQRFSDALDDAAVDRRTAGAIIEHNLGWRVEYAVDGASALTAMEKTRPRLVLTDMRMPGPDVLEVVRWARTHGVTCPFVILTGFADDQLRAAAALLGRTQVLGKPQSLGAIRAAVREALAGPRHS